MPFCKAWEPPASPLFVARHGVRFCLKLFGRQQAKRGKRSHCCMTAALRGLLGDGNLPSTRRSKQRKGKSSSKSVGIHTESGDYAACFLVLEPEVGKTYTLSGWVRTKNVIAREESAGAYIAASQFEFQGRPTQFSVDGKQIPEERFGNYTGSLEWQRISHSFLCLPSTDWFEIVVGVYRSSGSAWFSDLTFVEGDQPANFSDVVDYWQAAQWAHADGLRSQGRRRPAAAILRDSASAWNGVRPARDVPRFKPDP